MSQFAFLVHPRADVSQDLARVWSPFGAVPSGALEWGLRHLPVPPLTLGTVSRPDEGGVAGWLVVVPVGARQMLHADRRWVLGKVERAVDLAVDLGADVVGLGALTAPVTGGGRLLRPREGVTVTNGNAFTAQLTAQAVRRLVAGMDRPHVAVLGATGSVGSCVVQLLADDLDLGALTLVARRRHRLAELAQVMRSTRPGLPVHEATEVDAVRDADLVVVLTSSTEALLRSEHLKPGAVVLDDTQPRNTDPALAVERPDVLVVDGGLADVRGLDVRADIGLPHGYAYACLCETMLMAFDGCTTPAVGDATPAHARRMQAAADRFSHLGFGLAEPLSFGRPLAAGRGSARDLVGLRGPS
ncbi:semialdehyde dehydrogenase [Cellulomonas sp. PhB150]|uniref:semialdehyde dehydrogenase n=1 Tax=Cellulomonas sp. PhB150 TaxID=2485188 RepID=UPI000F4640B3|nr:semialdehyde dehydrogenase [Cellulomonas sp. PhB150]ROS28133.1 semialdehyde dehydrogenase family protein [Cellulomonas sp. PhB150]